ncbi:MAG: hypothetical protein ABIQ53_08065 [Terracoccus sp.]
MALPVYALIAAIVLERADLVSTGVVDGTVRIAAWVVEGYFFLRTGMNLRFAQQTLTGTGGDVTGRSPGLRTIRRGTPGGRPGVLLVHGLVAAG